ncbi:MAG: tRNA lysidine(34) synthetase TilS, partial [Gammaproteobacteria bacterium]|nr:tRNA lysidine(34) synthetase TilS [Gammaproteobacteria bacterium]
MTIDAAWLQQQIRRFPPASGLYVGFSGGLDSHVLLHLLAGIREDIPPLEAIHVHHGLQPQADDWTHHAQSVCDELGIHLTIIPVAIDANAGTGVEAAAREARYKAFAEAMKDGGGLLTAHHRDDQAETLLLQLFRGAGPAGLAAMPRWAPFALGWHGRPLLPISREGLEIYARRHQLTWIEDPSNEDTRFRRNFIRHRLMPLLQEEWPEVTESLANAASLQAESLNMMRTLGRLDLEGADGQEPGTLSIEALLRMQEQRRKNLIRYWLWEKGLTMPGRRHMSEIDKLLQAGPDSEAEVCYGDTVMRRYKNDLYAYRRLPDFDLEANYAWSRGEDIVNPANGELLRWRHLIDMGLDLASSGKGLTLRFRQGGERIKLPGHEHHKKIKHLMQEAGIPPWERDRIPFVYEGDRLL